MKKLDHYVSERHIENPIQAAQFTASNIRYNIEGFIAGFRDQLTPSEESEVRDAMHMFGRIGKRVGCGK